MQQTGIQPNHFTFASVLSTCANLASLEHGMEIHEKKKNSIKGMLVPLGCGKYPCGYVCKMWEPGEGVGHI
jgi:hypothetical protein